MMGYLKIPLPVFLVFSGLFFGYVIRCDSLNSIRNRRSHDLATLNLTRDLCRKSVSSVVICELCITVHTTLDECTDLDFWVLIDSKHAFLPRSILMLYWCIADVIRRPNFDLNTRNESLKPNQHSDSGSIHKVGTNSGWILGKRTSSHSDDGCTNHTNTFSMDNETHQSLHRIDFNHVFEVFELEAGIQLSLILVFILSRILMNIFLNIPIQLNKGARTVPGVKSNKLHLWKLMKEYLESFYFSIDQHLRQKGACFGRTKPCRPNSLKQELGVTMTTFSPPPQNIVVAPATELKNYFESMSQSDISNIDISLNIEILRLESFQKFPRSAPVSTIRLAENGFFCTGESDEVECFHCHVRYSGWCRGDSPFDIHKKISPSCDFICGMETSNVPLLQSSRQNSYKDNSTVYERFQTVRGPPEVGHETKVNDCRLISEENSGVLLSNTRSSNTIENEHHSNASAPASNSNTDDPALHSNNEGHGNQTSEESRIFQNKAEVITGSDREYLQNIGVRRVKPNETSLYKNSTNQSAWRTKYSGKLRLTPLPYVNKTLKYPSYAIPTIRLSSYKGWSSTSGHSPRSLSDAGFIYAGYGDLVRCFCCGGALRHWLPGDDPWIEHARWFPECVYLRQTKGDNFIILVHDDVKLPQMSGHNKITCQSASGATGSASPSVEDLLNENLKDPFSKKVKEMGFTMETIASAVTSLQRQGTPIDAFNVINEILASETISERVGLDEVDCFQRKQHTTGLKTGGQVQGSKTRMLQTEKKCKICLGSDACVVFSPCNHMVCCDECSPVLQKCPVCRQVIKGRLKTR